MDLFAQRKEIAKAEDGHVLSAFHHLVSVQFGIVRLHGARSRNSRSNGHTDSNGVLLVGKTPIQHGQIFLAVDRGQIHEVGDVGEQRDVEVTKVRHIGHRCERAPEHQYRGRIVVDAKVLRELVVGALDEGAANAEHGFAACLGNARSQCHGMFLGNAHIYKLLACRLSPLGCPVPDAGRTCCDGTDGFVLLHHVKQVRSREFIVGFHGDGMQEFARGNVEGRAPMETFLIGFGFFVPLSF